MNAASSTESLELLLDDPSIGREALNRVDGLQLPGAKSQRSHSASALYGRSTSDTSEQQRHRVTHLLGDPSNVHPSLRQRSHSAPDMTQLNLDDSIAEEEEPDEEIVPPRSASFCLQAVQAARGGNSVLRARSGGSADFSALPAAPSMSQAARHLLAARRSSPLAAGPGPGSSPVKLSPASPRSALPPAAKSAAAADDARSPYNEHRRPSLALISKTAVTVTIVDDDDS